ncbi:MAG: SDR family NAD(P)-dependent oxidoreductase [Chloroflexi bacterium]|nr:SDR family NAD(P)-dependent oxidoreductase [Chloroflexota bacterium]
MLDLIQRRCGTTLSRHDCYLRFQEMGFQYGPSFQTIEQIWVGPGEALGRIQVTDDIAAEMAEYYLHPAILDACFQLLLAVEPAEGDGGNRAANQYLPVGVGRIRVSGRPAPRMWAHARLVEYGAHALAGDISLLDDEGHVVIEIEGFRAQSLEGNESGSTHHLNEWLYHLAWETMDRDEEAAPGNPGSWLIFADRSGLAELLATGLAARDNSYVLVSPGESYRRTERRFVIDPTNPADYGRLLDDVAQTLPPVRGVVHLWSLDAVATADASAHSLQATQNLGCYAVMHLVQALAEAGQSPRLWLVTRGAQPVDPDCEELAIAQAPLWGIGRVIGHQEHLALRGALIDLDPVDDPEEAGRLIAEIDAPDGEDQLAFRDGRRYVARLQRSRPSNTVLPPRFRADGSYLITGGQGALGLLVARWMVERGARRLILMGRTPLPPRASWPDVPADSPKAGVIAAIRELEAMGASVHLAAVDVADEAQLAAFLREYRREGWPAIRGVVHAAGVVRDQILMRMDRERFESVLQPKMLGSWALHRQLAEEPLDFFTLFSSIASLVVSTGQANYASGNAFLDALAFYRRAQGLPATSINWGPWAVGMIDQLNLADHYAERGMEVIRPEQGMHIMDLLMGHHPAQSAVLAADWPRVFESYPFIPPMILHLGRDDSANASADEAAEESIAERLLRASSEERQGLVEGFLQEMVARVMRLDPSQLDLALPLNTLGMDSMMAIELKNRVEQGVNASLSVVDLLQGATIAQLAAQIAAQLEEQGPAAGTQGVPAADDAVVAELLQEIETLSDDEIAALLQGDAQLQEVA